MPRRSDPEAALLDQHAKVQAKLADEARKRAIIQAKLKAVYRQRTHQRHLALGNLADACGLEQVPLAYLEKAFRQIAEDWQTTHANIPPDSHELVLSREPHTSPEPSPLLNEKMETKHVT